MPRRRPVRMSSMTAEEAQKGEPGRWSGRLGKVGGEDRRATEPLPGSRHVGDTETGCVSVATSRDALSGTVVDALAANGRIRRTTSEGDPMSAVGVPVTPSQAPSWPRCRASIAPGEDVGERPGDSLEMNREHERYDDDTETDPVVDAALGGEPKAFGVDVAVFLVEELTLPPQRRRWARL